MDEPTAGLTRDEATELLDVVSLLKTQGATVLYISHTLEEVLSVADTVSVLRAGELVRSAPTASESVGSLVTAMLGRALELTFPEKALPAEDAPVVLSVQGLTGPGLVDDVSFDVRAGEIVGITGLIGSGRRRWRDLSRCRPHGCGNGYTRRGASPPAFAARCDPTRDRAPTRVARGRGTDDATIDRREHRASAPEIGQPAAVVRGSYEARRAAELIKRVDVRTHALTARLATLSGGNQQKVLFAKWLFRRPRVLVADEPTRGVDVGAKLRCMSSCIRSPRRECPSSSFVGRERGNRSRPSRPRHARRPCCRGIRRSRGP